jgi:hypothetical protein
MGNRGREREGERERGRNGSRSIFNSTLHTPHFFKLVRYFASYALG